MHFPPDDQLLGTGDFSLEGQSVTESGTFNNDITLQTENTAFWMGRKIGIAPDYRRYVFVYVNGQQRGMIYHDGQQPNGDVIEEYFPNDTNGHLHKIEDWFEFDDTGSGFSYITATLQNFTVNGQERTERYRWNWRPRAVGGSPNDFNDLFALVNAVNASSPDPYTAATLNAMDVRQWTRVFALEHAVGNWDSYGYQRGKNMYAYKPENGPWRLLLWDVQQIFNKGAHSTSESLFDINDSVMTKLLTHPPFAREYWGALNEMVDGPMLASNYGPLMDERYAALLANGLPVQDPASVKTWIDARRSYILSQIPQASFAVNEPASFSSPSNSIVLSGTAPVSAGGLLINGGAYPITWTAVGNWNIRVALTNAGLNTLVVQAIDRSGNAMPGLTATANVTYTGGVVVPEGNVVFNEILFRPEVPGADFVELFNAHSNYTFDLSNWRINGLDYVFPAGSTLAPRSYLVLAGDVYAHSQVYGLAALAFGQYSGKLDPDGETLTLLRPGAVTNTEVVVDRVRYEAVVPWPAVTNGVSLQLVDAVQDNSRVANWNVWLTNSSGTPPPASLALLAFADSWRYMQSSNLDGVNWQANNFNDSSWPSGSGLLAFENNAAINGLIHTTLVDPRIAIGNVAPGHAYYFRTALKLTNSLAGYTINASAYIDDGAVIYVNGAEITPRIRMNGGTVLNTTLASGNPGNGDATTPDTFTIPASAFVVGTNYIAVEVHQATAGSSDIVFGLKLDAIYTAVVSTGSATPGRANSVAAVLPAFPPVWLNEVQPQDVTGPFDNAGQRDPWTEIYNPALTNFSLAGYYLTDSYTNLTKWAFPGSAVVAANGFTMVWCDNETNQTTGSALHANSRLAAGTGNLALARMVGNTVQVVDYLNYASVPPNWSYGDVPDGQPFYRQTMFAATPGATNSGSSAPITIFINEWMADNSATLLDPADNNYEDWFELFNPGSSAVDLGGYYLTDTLTNKFQFQVPNNGHYVVPAGGFMLVWADNESGQNNTNRADLHVNFALSKGGEAIGLFAPDGTQIDAVIFGGQTTDTSQGRFPDGLGSTSAMPTPTPGSPNVIPAPPQFNTVSVTNGTVSFTLSVTPGQPYRIEYKNDLGTGSWLPLLPDQVGVVGPVLFQHPLGTNQQRFYRVIQLN